MVTDRLLKRIHEIVPLSSNSLDLLLSSARQVVLKKGQPLLPAGQICNDLYFVESGFLRTYVLQEGHEINIHFTLEGDFTSNLKSLKSRQSSEYAIEAGEAAVITLFDKDTLFHAYQHTIEIESFCRRILAQLQIDLTEHITFFKRFTAWERYQHLIKTNPRIVQRVSITQLSSYLGIARETLSRIRKQKS